ncbi:hypothetical protein [Paenibacillus polymyxa]|uniref:hypothetical protein n=1 Tax=Paenibacillus polymyxa TaxID=1406 RepID=UPI001319BCBA|nr:hypothetical protein [Paenibacillus polymyxa]
MTSRLPSARGHSSARHAAEREGFACCAHVLRCARIRWLTASLLEPARSREDSRLFATQIRQPSRARCFAIEKQWNTLFYRSSGWCGILCAAPSLVLLPHEGWCWKQRSGRNRSGEALALAFASGYQPLQVYSNPGIQGQQQSEE